MARTGEWSKKAMTEFGKLHFAFNNAGVEGALKQVHELTEEEFDVVYAVNVKGVFMSMKYEVPAILESGGGVIVNCSSVAGNGGRIKYDSHVSLKSIVRDQTLINPSPAETA